MLHSLAESYSGNVLEAHRCIVFVSKYISVDESDQEDILTPPVGHRRVKT